MEFALRVFHQTDSDQPLFYRANPQPCNSCFHGGACQHVDKCIGEVLERKIESDNESRAKQGREDVF